MEILSSAVQNAAPKIKIAAENANTRDATDRPVIVRHWKMLLVLDDLGWLGWTISAGLCFNVKNGVCQISKLARKNPNVYVQ